MKQVKFKSIEDINSELVVFNEGKYAVIGIKKEGFEPLLFRMDKVDVNELIYELRRLYIEKNG